jgi:Ribbon-helix-helix domain
MQDAVSESLVFITEPDAPLEAPGRQGDEVVSTHVLVPAEQVERLRMLAKKTRVAQSEYLREAVEDLLRKYAGEK